MRRGQAALEFLTTYGWAFLVILVMIGALAYFGILSPDKFLPERCTFSTETPCRDMQVSVSDGVKFYVTNNIGEKITAINFTVTSVDTGTSASCTPSGTAAEIDVSASKEFTCSGSSFGLSEGSKAKFLVEGNYTRANGKYPKQVSGEIYAKVVA